ncbi:MAG: GH32 C-terminal domain-containing protein, partial [Verrucomicrobiota bacterium]
VLFVRRGSAHFLTSDDLKNWTPTSEVRLPGFRECPDLFELPVDGNKKNMKWVLYDAPFDYWIGSFDGKEFKPEAGPLRGDSGQNLYAAQSWHNTKDRRIQIGWMRNGKYPEMPFNQQMSFPCELFLRTTAKGIRLFRYPVKEIESLYCKPFELKDYTLKSGDNPLSEISGDLFDIEMEIEPGDVAEFGVRLHETTVTYAGRKVSCFGCTADASPIKGKLKLRMLVDRASVEVFANDGEVSMTSCFLPKEKNTRLELYTKDGNVNIRSLRITKLKSSWPTDTPH